MSDTCSQKNQPGDQAGFTLVELLVVLAILGFLAAIATPQVMKYLSSAKMSTAKTEIEALAGALDLYKFDVGRYPSSDEGLTALVKSPEGVEGWNGPYVKRTANLVDPWGHEFKYRSPGEHGEFDIFSQGAGAADSDDEGKAAVASW